MRTKYYYLTTKLILEGWLNKSISTAKLFEIMNKNFLYVSLYKHAK